MNSGLPRITVVTPSYNQAAFLETTMLSVLGQCYPNLEYIVVDGGSTDGSAKIIERHAAKLAYWQSVQDGGQADALNQGFARATGDILCWINSDDFLLPGTLHRVAQLLGPFIGQPALIYGACLFFDDAGRGAKVIRPIAHDSAILRSSAYIIQPSAFWTRSLWDVTGPLDSVLHFAFDWEWFIRASSHAQFVRCQELFSAYRQHASHKSGTGGERRLEEILAVVRRHGAPEDVTCFSYAAKTKAVWTRRRNLASLLVRASRSASKALALLGFPQLWKLPPDIAPARLERARAMLD